jgi:hypothetical protein
VQPFLLLLLLLGQQPIDVLDAFVQGGVGEVHPGVYHVRFYLRCTVFIEFYQRISELFAVADAHSVVVTFELKVTIYD